ncbi:hypothetical protein GDO81_002093 [Engystomops pustulosus]|uniref:Olfactory receptor n=1 Tax=Engystomops pustulosus TaxID=76066 RepID=A0AAV7DJM9_ENGPU|nr:hypothetical protein GDO81_002093 [Engystomops pustulosus]
MTSLCVENNTVKYIAILGFQGAQGRNIFLSIVFILLYLLIIFGNGLIITTVSLKSNLQKPMYYLLATFSGLEICYTSVFMPWIITSLSTGLQKISLLQCEIQLYFYVSFGVSELFLLAVMAFDRYQAICNPFHYMEVMSPHVCAYLALTCWVGGFVFNLPLSLMLQKLDFRGNSVINHFMCDGPAVLQLSCSDTTHMNLISFILALVTMLTSLILTMLSYIWVIHTILKLPTHTVKSKTFSTCSSHLTAAGMYYGTLIFIYARPQFNNSYDMNKVVSVFYTIIVPLLNPLIYSLRNKEFKKAVRKLTI